MMAGLSSRFVVAAGRMAGLVTGRITVRMASTEGIEYFLSQMSGHDSVKCRWAWELLEEVTGTEWVMSRNIFSSELMAAWKKECAMISGST